MGTVLFISYYCKCAVCDGDGDDDDDDDDYESVMFVGCAGHVVI